MSIEETPIEFPETPITEDTFERQGWEKVDEMAEEGDDEDNGSDDADDDVVDTQDEYGQDEY